MFIAIKYKLDLKLGCVESKTGSSGEKFVCSLKATVLIQSPYNFARMLIKMKSSPSLKLFYMRSEARSLAQSLEKTLCTV